MSDTMNALMQWADEYPMSEYASIEFEELLSLQRHQQSALGKAEAAMMQFVLADVNDFLEYCQGTHYYLTGWFIVDPVGVKLRSFTCDAHARAFFELANAIAAEGESK